MEISENDVLDVEAVDVKGKYQGEAIPALSKGGGG